MKKENVNEETWKISQSWIGIRTISDHASGSSLWKSGEARTFSVGGAFLSGVLFSVVGVLRAACKTIDRETPERHGPCSHTVIYNDAEDWDTSWMSLEEVIRAIYHTNNKCHGFCAGATSLCESFSVSLHILHTIALHGRQSVRLLRPSSRQGNSEH